MMGPLEFLICIFIIICSAYLSASEVALFSLSRFQIRFLKDHFRPIHRRVKKLLSDPGGVLVTILIVNEVLNIALASFITHWSVENQIQFPLSILITFPIILIFCEITPKVIGVRANQLVIHLTSKYLSWIYDFFKPIRFIINKSISFIYPSHPTKKPVQLDSGILKESDFLLLLEEGHKEGSIQEHELELIRNVFELDHTKIIEITTPHHLVITLPLQTPLEDAIKIILNQPYSRIPITGENKTKIVGILFKKDLLKYKLQAKTHSISHVPTIAELMHKPYFISEQTRLNAIFRKFKKHKTHMAIVNNQKDEWTGVVTMSDVLEALFEDFFEDDTPAQNKKIGQQP